MISPTDWREEPGVEYWTAIYKFQWTFENVTKQLLETSPVKLLSKPFGDNRWQISVGTIAKTPGYLGVFLGAAQDIELLTSKTWIRRCESCTATLGTPLCNSVYGIEKNISGGYTFNAGLESRRGQAKYIKLDKLFADPAFLSEKALFVQVTLSERRRTTQPSPFGDIQRFAGRSARFSTLFDDPDCSDVCFVFPKRKGKPGLRTIYAQKYIIRSLPYFNTMFESGFLESGETQSQADSVEAAEMSLSPPPLMQVEQFSSPDSTFAALAVADGSATASIADDSVMADGQSMCLDDCAYDEDDSDFELDHLDDIMRGVQQAADHLTLADVGTSSETHNFLTPSIIDRPSKKRRISQIGDKQNQNDDDIEVDEVKKGIHRVTITSTPYTTYRALLLYIYSNSIAWAPLRSNWLVHKQRMESKGRSPGTRATFVKDHAVKFSLAMGMNELQATSPKSMYVLADMLQLPELREEALNQFVRSLQVENICIELGSSFLGKYDRVRHLAFEFLKSNKTVTQTHSFAKLMEEGLSNVSAAVRGDFQKLFKSLDIISPSIRNHSHYNGNAAIGITPNNHSQDNHNPANAPLPPIFPPQPNNHARHHHFQLAAVNHHHFHPNNPNHPHP